jgi:hypothetical protein
MGIVHIEHYTAFVLANYKIVFQHVAAVKRVINRWCPSPRDLRPLGALLDGSALEALTLKRECLLLDSRTHHGGWKNYPGLRCDQKAPARFAQFFGVGAGRRRPPRFAAMSTSPAAAPCPPLTQSRNHATGRHPMRRRSCRGYGVEAGAGFAMARSAVRTRSAPPPPFPHS